MDEEPDVLSLIGVYRRYKDVLAVDGVSLTVREGEFVALLGPSGARKSTTLRLIAGLEQPDVGDIRIRGRSVASVPAYRRDIGIVFQQYALFPHMTVAENIAFPWSQAVEAAGLVGRRVAMHRSRASPEPRPSPPRTSVEPPTPVRRHVR